MVYGTAAGEVRLEVRYQGALFGSFRALVLQMKRVPCRCNILNGPTPDSTQPYGHGYASATALTPPAVVSPLAAPTVSLSVADLLP